MELGLPSKYVGVMLVPDRTTKRAQHLDLLSAV